MADYWKNQIEQRRASDLIDKFYVIQDHKTLYQDIGEIVLKSHSILNSDIVPIESKEKFADVLVSLL